MGLPTDALASQSRMAAYASEAALVTVGAFTLQEWAAIIGIVLAVGTFLINWYYTRARARRDVMRLGMERDRAAMERARLTRPDDNDD